MRGTSLRRRLALLFVVAGVVTGVLTVLVVVALHQLAIASRDRVERYGPAALEVVALAKAYSDQETGLRGFLIGGREDFLEPYRSGRQEERRTLRRLEQLVSARPELVTQLDEVRAEARSWHQEVAEPAIARVRTEGPLQLSQADVSAAKQRFDRVRSAVRDLDRPVVALRDEAGRALDRTNQQLRVILFAGLVGLLTLAALTWRALRRWVVTPLRDLGTEVDRVDAGDVSRQVTLHDAPAEISELAEQVERMRERTLHEYDRAEASRLEALQARAAVEEQAENLRRSNAELEQFAYVASHDLQEPLRKVASFCQLLERRYKGQLDERGEQYIDFAVDGAKRMQQLINDLLSFSRVGRNTADFTAVPLDDVVDRAVRQLDTLIEEAGARVTRDSLPAVQGDPSLLVQLLQNLIGNGVKFRSEQLPHVHIGVAGSATGDLVELYCRDNGIGIEHQYEEKIFVIFQRLHGRDTYTGTGIGLAMCRKIVEFHGGRLWLDTSSVQGTGATFRFTLPSAVTPTRHDHDDKELAHQ